MPIRTYHMRFIGSRLSIKGNTTAKGYEGWIELSSVAMAPAFPSNGNASETAETVVAVTKRMDSATPVLFQLASSGERVTTIQIDLVRSIGNKSTCVTFMLQNVCISSFQSGNGTDSPEERIELSCTKITFDIHGVGPDVSDHAKALMRQ